VIESVTQAGEVALLFPGQGSQHPAMLSGIREHPFFRARYELICDRIGLDVLRQIEVRGPQLLDTNLIGSLVTVLVSSVSLEIYTSRGLCPPAFVGGYSVGQWSAMYAAGMIEFELLVDILAERARLMDECVRAAPGGMCAVIGVSEQAIEAVCGELRASGHEIHISNFNCRGQYSLAGTPTALERAEHELRLLGPKRLLRLNAAGGWHSPLVAGAATQFRELLEKHELRPPRMPVLDNVTGDWLPRDYRDLCATLACHIHQPVRWEQGVRKLIDCGAARLIEVGYGNCLTKFGFFISRSVEFEAFYH